MVQSIRKLNTDFVTILEQLAIPEADICTVHTCVTVCLNALLFPCLIGVQLQCFTLTYILFTQIQVSALLEVYLGYL